ncbi:MAG TPA: alpha/beta hydrolase [Arthrobacter sp.]|nr:alpha/beta hydrolase [Arthrobacter sp.]
MNTHRVENLPIVLVPGYWLGGWAWDDVVERLRADGCPAVPVTLPGLESPAAPRAGIRLGDHVDAVRAALDAAHGPVVLVAHSGAGAIASAVLDVAAHQVARVVYVDSGPVADGNVPRPDLPSEAAELPMPSFPDLEADGGSLEGLDDAVRRQFRERAVAHPAGPLREPIALPHGLGVAVPTTVVCCSFPSQAVRSLVASGEPMFSALADLSDVTYVDLPTGHWPMWSRPDALADLLAGLARG